MSNLFKKVDWFYTANVYEVNLRQYSEAGTLNAFLGELPRLRAMGVQTLWFMPLTPISVKNRKGSMGSQYACSDYTAVGEEFGTLDDFKKLVRQAHNQGFKVIIDWVANHTGWDHVWTKSNPDYYKIDPQTQDFKMASGMEDIIELDYSNPAMRKAMIEAMRFWITETDIDGFRCDLAFWVELDFWLEARAALEETKVLFWLAENDGIENPHYYQAFDACYTWTWMHKTKEFYEQGAPVSMLRELLYQYDALGDTNALKLWFTSNHDENSWNGTEYEKYGDAAIPFAVMNATWNGIPLLYSGQELPNKKRLQFFEKDVIEWNGHYELEAFYRTLFQLRSTHPALRAGDPAVGTCFIDTGAEDQVLSYLRKHDEHEILILLNLSNRNASVKLQSAQLDGNFKNCFTSELIRPSGMHQEMQPWSWMVLEKMR